MTTSHTERERKRRHDDVHFPMGGRGKRGSRPKSGKGYVPDKRLVPTHRSDEQGGAA